MDPQFAALELPGLAMEEVHKRQVPRCHPIAGVVTVEVEVIPVVTGCDLSFYLPAIENSSMPSFSSTFGNTALIRSSITSW